MEKGNEKKERVVVGRSLIDLVFSWSVKDVLNSHLYKSQVKQIQTTFSSTSEYLRSFGAPLVEETRADLSSSMETLSHPLCCKLRSIRASKDYKPPKDLFYKIVLRPSESDRNNIAKPYEPETGDIIAITRGRPRQAGDLERSYGVAYVRGVTEDRVTLYVLLSKPFLVEEGDYNNDGRSLNNIFATYLINMTTNVRIWQALNSDPDKRNSNLIGEVLGHKFMEEMNCTTCQSNQTCSDSHSYANALIRSSDLNESQKSAVLSCISARECRHQSTVKLIWGPPGTGKTKTVSSLLHSLMMMKCRTLTCTPTNMAILEVTQRLVKKVKDSGCCYGLGDIVLFGNGKRMKIDDRDELRDVFLDHRIDALDRCLGSKSGWRESLVSVISLLEDPEKEYSLYSQNSINVGDNDDSDGDSDGKEMDSSGGLSAKQAILRALKENKKNQKSEIKKEKKEERCLNSQDSDGDDGKKESDSGGGDNNDSDEKEIKVEESRLTFGEFVKRRFESSVVRLISHIDTLCAHLPTSLLRPEAAKTMLEAAESLESLQESLRRSAKTEEVERVFRGDDSSERARSLSALKLVPSEFPVPISKETKEFLLANAFLIFCTVSSSSRLNSIGMAPFEYLVVDEAAQLKECESAIPLQLPGIRHAVLIGDERQLPAMVKSKVSVEANFGRSLFERLSSLGRKKHLLNVQHRMHPSISSFPNREFYGNKILNGPNVTLSNYDKRFLEGKMFGSYSFINVAHGREVDNNHSTKNMVEVAVVSEIIASVYKEVKSSKKKVRVGVIAPYKAQVYAICDRLGKQYSSDPSSDFSVSVRSVDGFQGGEEDLIIISTVRSNTNGSLGFVSNRQRANVALTRARHCLWIVGNGETLGKRRSVWKNLVNDAKERDCFHNADEDNNLAQAIVASLVGLNQIHFDAKWKVRFEDGFWSSIARIRNYELCKEMLSVLDKLSRGWRGPPNERVSSEFVECYKIKQMYLFWAVDTLREISHHVQVLKVWGFVNQFGVSSLSKKLDTTYQSYTSDKKSRCKYKHIEENLVVPMRWPAESHSEEEGPINLSKSMASLSLGTEQETSSSSSSTRKKSFSTFRASTSSDSTRWKRSSD